jgi:hypothetical protein
LKVIGSRFFAKKEPITFQNILFPYISIRYQVENLLLINYSREPIIGFLILFGFSCIIVVNILIFNQIRIFWMVIFPFVVQKDPFLENL